MWGTVGRSLGRSRREAKDTEWWRGFVKVAWQNPPNTEKGERKDGEMEYDGRWTCSWHTVHMYGIITMEFCHTINVNLFKNEIMHSIPSMAEGYTVFCFIRSTLSYSEPLQVSSTSSKFSVRLWRGTQSFFAMHLTSFRSAVMSHV
jgi:hypothetical protein